MVKTEHGRNRILSERLFHYCNRSRLNVMYLIICIARPTPKYTDRRSHSLYRCSICRIDGPSPACLASDVLGRSKSYLAMTCKVILYAVRMHRVPCCTFRSVGYDDEILLNISSIQRYTVNNLIFVSSCRKINCGAKTDGHVHAKNAVGTEELLFIIVDKYL